MAIRPDTDPKSAAPRSGAPKGELEQYGVWVKAEPQDIIEEAASPRAEDFDFEVPGDSAALPEESFLSEDEEKLLGTFDSEFETPEIGSAEVGGADQGPLPDIEDLPPLEEGLLEGSLSPPTEGVEDLGSSTIDISLEELDGGRESSPISPYAKIDMGSVEGLESAHSAMEDVSSDFLDIPAEAPSPLRPKAAAAHGAEDVTAQFLEAAESGSTPQAEEAAPDFEPLDIDLHFDDTLPAPGAAGSEAGSQVAGFEEVTEFDDFLSAGGEEAAPQPRKTTQVEKAEAFDDLAAVERDLSVRTEDSATAVREAAGRQDLSTEILLKIADELASIRGELVSLKTQLSSIKVETAAVGAAPSTEETPSEPSSSTGGFFDEEEDETIALTGDELDNILNTADFTEEVAAAESPEEEALGSLQEMEVPSAEISILDEPLLPETGDYTAAATPSPIEEIHLGETGVEELQEVPEPSVEETPGFEEISLMAEEGVHPMTEAPEDTSYLEEAGKPDAMLDLNEAALSDVPLIEPDLSAFQIEPEELESVPLSEIEGELPVVETEPAPAAAATPPQDMALDIDVGPEYGSIDLASDVEPLEPIPEIDESAFGEINLHKESATHVAPEVEDLADLEELSGETARLEEEIPLEVEEDLILEQPPSVPKTPIPEPENLPAMEEIPEAEEAEAAQASAQAASRPVDENSDRLKTEIRSVLTYLDKLLDSLPEDKIEEFARSEHFDTYKRLFEELGLV